MVDTIRFQEAVTFVQHRSLTNSAGIGTLREKTLHAVLKYYYEPHCENHEITIGQYVADIVDENGIIEIQTAHLSPLKAKLTAFLEVCPVTVVHPVACKRRLLWINPQTGDVSAPRRAPCKDPRAEIFLELCRVRDFLKCPNLTFCFPLLEIDEYRFLNLKQKNPHKKASRLDKIPTSIHDEWMFQSLKDYFAYLPAGLPLQYDSAMFAKKAQAAVSTARIMLNVLNTLGIVKRIGKKGNSYLYESVRHPSDFGL